MERFKSEPPQAEVKKKSAIWKKFEKYGKIVALSTLLSLPGIESAFGQEKGEQTDIKTKIEQLKEKAAGHVKDIVVVVKEKGQAGKMGETPVRRWKTPDGKTATTVGYSADETKAQWLIHEGNDASMRFFDKNADGSVDRVIINKENPALGARQKAGFNDLKTFDSMQNLADEAGITADLDPENVKVYEISFENGNFVIKTVDFQTGEASELSGPDAAEMAGKVQGSFTNTMESVDQQLGK